MPFSNHSRRQDRLNWLTEIYRAYVGDLQRFLSNKIGDPALAEDLTSTVFLKALRWRRRGSERRLRPWVALRDGSYHHRRTLAGAESVRDAFAERPGGAVAPKL
jgi:Sigma-70 region 2